MKRYETQDIRNVVLVGHRVSRTACSADAIQYAAHGTTRRRITGTVSSNYAYQLHEIKRQGTIRHADRYVGRQKKKVNFSEWPGDQNVSSEPRVAMQVAA